MSWWLRLSLGFLKLEARLDFAQPRNGHLCERAACALVFRSRFKRENSLHDLREGVEVRGGDAEFGFQSVYTGGEGFLVRLQPDDLLTLALENLRGDQAATGCVRFRASESRASIVRSA